MQETNHIWILYKLMLVIFFIGALPSVYMTITDTELDYPSLANVGIVLVLYFAILLVLGRITAEVDQASITVGMGPFKSTTPIENVQSVRSTTIRPLRDFLGWGWRVRADGTRGYIADGDVGIEITRDDGSRTVVTVSDPQRFVDYIHWAKANQSK